MDAAQATFVLTNTVDLFDMLLNLATCPGDLASLNNKQQTPQKQPGRHRLQRRLFPNQMKRKRLRVIQIFTHMYFSTLQSENKILEKTCSYIISTCETEFLSRFL